MTTQQPTTTGRRCARDGCDALVIGNSRRRYCSERCQRATHRANAEARGYRHPPRTVTREQLAANRARQHRRRARIAATDALGVLATTGEMVDMLLTAKRCALCRHALTFAAGPRQRHLDHIIPIAAGGSHAIDNLRVLCRTCNLGRPCDGSDVTGQTSLWQTVPPSP